MSRKQEFHAQIAAIKKLTPKGIVQAERTAQKTQGVGG